MGGESRPFRLPAPRRSDPPSPNAARKLVLKSVRFGPQAAATRVAGVGDGAVKAPRPIGTDWTAWWLPGIEADLRDIRFLRCCNYGCGRVAYPAPPWVWGVRWRRDAASLTRSRKELRDRFNCTSTLPPRNWSGAPVPRGTGVVDAGRPWRLLPPKLRFPMEPECATAARRRLARWAIVGREPTTLRAGGPLARTPARPIRFAKRIETNAVSLAAGNEGRDCSWEQRGTIGAHDRAGRDK